MTDISEVLASLKRSNLSLEEIAQEVEQTLKTSKKGLEDLNKSIEGLIESEKKQNEEISKYESYNLSLSKEISTLKEEKASKESLLTSTQEKYNDTTEKRTKLEAKIRDTRSILNDTSKNLEAAKNDLQNLTQENERILAEIERLVNSFDKQIMDVNKLAEQKRDSLQKVKGERIALEYLIKKNYVEFNEMKIISSLEGRKTTDLNTISKVTGLAENLIIKTLEGLQKRNLLQYNTSTGEIVITGSLRI